uniref:Gonadotropin subunit beta-2 n=1 Tax=Poecilia reticulata TaxID=8081 RepID=A0A3P9Q4Y3_POERE
MLSSFQICRVFFCFVFLHISVYTCTLMNHTIWLEKKNCTQCVAVNTTICSGYCYTRDTNLKGSFGRAFLIQRSCVPISLVYRAAFIPGCPQDDSSQLYYPAARCCSCRRCDTRTHHCVKPRPLYCSIYSMRLIMRCELYMKNVLK